MADKRRVEISITTFRHFSIGASHYYVSIREEEVEGHGFRFDSMDFKYKPHAKKWADMIISEYFDSRSHEIVWDDVDDDQDYDLEDYKLRTPGRF